MPEPIIIPGVEFDTLKRIIESDDFYFDAAVASSPQSLFRRILATSAAESLAKFVKQGPENVKVVLDYARMRASEVTSTERSPQDVALCACLIGLANDASPEVEEFLKSLQTSSIGGLKWASEIASLIARKVRVTSLSTRTELSAAAIISLNSSTARSDVAASTFVVNYQLNNMSA